MARGSQCRTPGSGASTRPAHPRRRRRRDRRLMGARGADGFGPRSGDPYVDTITVYKDVDPVMPRRSVVHLSKHSCSPTLWHVGPYELAARRQVCAGEELTIDYGRTPEPTASSWTAKPSGADLGSEGHSRTGRRGPWPRQPRAQQFAGPLHRPFGRPRAGCGASRLLPYGHAVRVRFRTTLGRLVVDSAGAAVADSRIVR